MSLALATMVGCQNENDVQNVQDEVSNMVFTASFENNDSRTALQGENNNVVWVAGDKLSVFAGKTVNKPFILNEGEGTSYGTFTFDALSAGTSTNTSSSANLSANVAYYPYSQDVTVSESNGSFTFDATFPVKQVYSESGTFGNGASPMVAVTASKLDDELMFKNVGGIFRLQLQNADNNPTTISKIVFSAEGHNLAGQYQVTTSNNTTDQTLNVTEGSSTITLDCGEGVQLSSSEPTNFVVAMLPVSNAPLTIVIYDAAGNKMTYTDYDNLTLERSGAKSTDVVTYNGTEKAITNGADLIAALEQSTSGSEIVVEGDIVLEEPLNIGTSNNVNLDLNGHTLTFTASTSSYSSRASADTYGITNSGTLKIKNGEIIDNLNDYTIYNKQGIVELENVNITSSYVAVYNEGVWENNMTTQKYSAQGEATVKFTVNGGSITSTSEVTSSNIYAVMGVDYGLITVKNAEIKGTSAAGGIHLNCAEASLDNVTITRGTTGTAHQVHVLAGILNYTKTVIDNYRYYYGDDKGKYGYAEVNGKYYGEVNQQIVFDEITLKNAFSNFEDGAVVVLNSDITVDEQLTFNNEGKTLNIDLNGKTLALTTSSYGIVNKAGKLVIANGNINSSNSYAIYNYGETELNNVALSASNVAVYNYGVWEDGMTTQKYSAQGEATVKFTVNGGSITSTSEVTSSNIYAVMGVDYGLITVKNAEIKGTSAAGGIHLNCAEASLDNVTIIRGTAGTAHQVHVLAGILNYTNTVIDNYRYYYGDDKGQYGYAEVNGRYYGEVNQEVTLASDAASLKGALSNIQNGAVVMLSSDITVDEQLTFNNADKTLNIDLNGKTLTLNAAEKGIVNNAGKLVIANGNIISSSSYAIYNYGETELNNVALSASNVAVYNHGVWENGMTTQIYSAQGEATVKFTVNGGSITSTSEVTSSNIYAVMGVDYGLITVKNAEIKGTSAAGGIHLNCAEASLDNVTIIRGTAGTAHQVHVLAGILNYTNTVIDNYRYYYGDDKGQYGYAEVNGRYYGEVNQEVTLAN